MVKIGNKSYDKINIGCGRQKKNCFPSPWLNVDISADAADFVCDIRRLPSEWEGQLNEIRASHVLEHFFLQEMDGVLHEWFRTLASGGLLRIIVPDLDIIIRDLVRGRDSKNRQSLSIQGTTAVLAQIYGVGYDSNATEDSWRHRIIFNERMLTDLLSRQPEVSEVRKVSANKDPASWYGINDDSQNPFSLCMLAWKK